MALDEEKGLMIAC